MNSKSAKPSAVATSAPFVVSASKFIGEAVVNHQKESVGKIQDLVFDTERGTMAYVVLSFGGIMGMGNKLFAVPWKAFEISPTDHRVVLGVDKEKLKNAPGFDQDHWPDFADRSWGERVHGYYGYPTGWNM